MSTVYRVATAYSYDRTIDRLQQRGAQLAELQDQLSSGKRVRRISDDPAAAALAEREQARMQRIQSDQRALEAARRNIELAESTLGTINDLYHRVKELIVQGGNGALTPADRRTIADELEGLRERIVALANTQDTYGRPLFMGQGVTNALGRPFRELITAPAATTYGPDGREVQKQMLRGQSAPTDTALPMVIDGYPVFAGRIRETAAAIVAAGSGNSGSARGVEVQVNSLTALNTTQVFTLDDSTNDLGLYTLSYSGGTWSVSGTDKTGAPFGPVSPVAVNTSGDITELTFEGLTVRLRGTPANGDTFTVTPTVDTDIWETLDRAIGALRTESGDDLTQELAVVHRQLGARLDRLLTARGQLGDWLNRADAVQAALKAREDYHIAQQSELTDLDMVEAISRFQTQQLAYQAGLSSYAQIQRLSLFQYLA
ncbi:Flagellar hook-associated protein 3 [Tepidimonas alkaliphilus]|uniref:Flagellar hook-associated protein 3 n=1 Tax=Tepidimonas alkaliphilus TaxID=2588942 RepID=A0A554WB31_9BURK|nr:flagellar hook-associated protein FlgL [Tepidimonas alkaliphilus]TSE20766.1 Flagellar hook-associated protein 3 [Tepidimonas alkaliphilus]